MLTPQQTEGLFYALRALTADGVGEWTTTSIGVGEGNNMRLTHEIRFPHSLGLLYSAFTYYCGFKVNSGEYKLMGLAPYGEAKYTDLILEKVLDLKPDGQLCLTGWTWDGIAFEGCDSVTLVGR